MKYLAALNPFCVLPFFHVHLHCNLHLVCRIIMQLSLICFRCTSEARVCVVYSCQLWYSYRSVFIIICYASRIFWLQVLTTSVRALCDHVNFRVQVLRPMLCPGSRISVDCPCVVSDPACVDVRGHILVTIQLPYNFCNIVAYCFNTVLLHNLSVYFLHFRV